MESQYCPTARLDYQATSNLSISRTWNLYNRYQSLSSKVYPLPELEHQGRFANTWYVASLGATWTITPRMLNEFKYGVQHNVDQYSKGSIPGQYDINGNGRRIRLSLPLISPIVSNEAPTSRANMLTTLYDNLSVTRGAHQITMSGNYRHAYWFDASYSGMPGAPLYTVGFANPDPITSVFNNTTISGLPSTENSNVQSLYALLAGRLTGVSLTKMVDIETRKYSEMAPFIALTKSDVGGFYFQDTWRWKPNVTFNLGFRWQFQGAQYDANGIVVYPDFANLMGPSTQMFKPGELNGVAKPMINAGKTPYKGDMINPAPSVGIAWPPKAKDGILKKILLED